jgi:hypothetical protein
MICSAQNHFQYIDRPICTTHVKTHKSLQVCKQVVLNVFTNCRQVVFALLVLSCCYKHGRTGRKKLGGRKEICPTFSDFARPVPKFFFPEQINLDAPPPPPSPEKFRSVYHFRGPKIFRTYQNFSRHHKFSRYNKISNEINRISHKIYRICPIYFYNKPNNARLWSEYCPTGFVCPTNWGGGLAPPPARYAHGYKFGTSC